MDHLWNEVIDVYLDKKNMYLSHKDNNHPLFNVYAETININISTESYIPERVRLLLLFWGEFYLVSWVRIERKNAVSKRLALIRRLVFLDSDR